MTRPKEAGVEAAKPRIYQNLAAAPADIPAVRAEPGEVDTRLARPAGSGCCFGALVEPRQTCGRCARCWSQRADREAGRDPCAGADELTSINGSIEAHALVLLCWHG